jgi:hypothetical protein
MIEVYIKVQVRIELHLLRRLLLRGLMLCRDSVLIYMSCTDTLASPMPPSHPPHATARLQKAASQTASRPALGSGSFSMDMRRTARGAGARRQHTSASRMSIFEPKMSTTASGTGRASARAHTAGAGRTDGDHERRRAHGVHVSPVVLVAVAGDVHGRRAGGCQRGMGRHGTTHMKSASVTSPNAPRRTAVSRGPAEPSAVSALSSAKWWRTRCAIAHTWSTNDVVLVKNRIATTALHAHGEQRRACGRGGTHLKHASVLRMHTSGRMRDSPMGAVTIVCAARQRLRPGPHEWGGRTIVAPMRHGMYTT